MGKKEPYFEGWYMKHQKGDQFFAVIPGIRREEGGSWSAFVQVITAAQSYYVHYDPEEFGIQRKPLRIRVGENVFSRQGIRLSIERDGLSLKGAVRYGELSPVSGDLMGPFAWVPGMECSHGVISMSHRLQGAVVINGERIDVTGGSGYWETDRGQSFPKRYFWTQCQDQGLLLMTAAATIPFGGLSFDGCLGVIRFGGQEYRVATYLGARIERWSKRLLVLRQRSLRLEIRTGDGGDLPLKAPSDGRMDLEIRECLRGDAYYRLTIGRRLIFEVETDKASTESFEGPCA